MSKRKLDEYLVENEAESIESKSKQLQKESNHKKHSLDSDEEDDSEDDYDVLHEDDIEGAEDDVTGLEKTAGITAFNMKDELEEGCFDSEGNFHWKKEKQIRDNWLDSVDWQNIHKLTEDSKNITVNEKGLGDESSDSDEENFDEIASYSAILKYLKPNESVAAALKRLGSSSNISSQERWKNKKTGSVTTSSSVTDLTGLANELLSQTGNMDVYQETYETISNKINKDKNKKATDIDMYADDFTEKEKSKLGDQENLNENVENSTNEVFWEYKWSQNDTATYGPFSAQQMQHWVTEGYFKDGVWVRKVGSNGSFFISNRIDFELYY